MHCILCNTQILSTKLNLKIDRPILQDIEDMHPSSSSSSVAVLYPTLDTSLLQHFPSIAVSRFCCSVVAGTLFQVIIPPHLWPPSASVS